MMMVGACCGGFPARLRCQEQSEKWELSRCSNPFQELLKID